MPSFLYAERLYLNHHVLSFATKSHGIKSKKNAQPQMFEEEEVELFDLEPYLENLKDIEATAISSFDQITPVTITINDLQNVPVTMKNGSKILGDLAQIVFKTNFLVNLHIFDVSDKNRVVRALYLFSSDFAVEVQEGDLIVVRLPKTQSPAAIQQLKKKIQAVQNKEVQNIMKVRQNAESKIKKVKIGNNWHKRELDRLEKAVKVVLETIKKHKDQTEKKINI